MAGATVAGEEAFAKVTRFDGVNATADSLLLAQLVSLWVLRLRTATSFGDGKGSEEGGPKDSKGRRSSRRPIIRLRDDFEPEEYVFKPLEEGAGLDKEDGLPFGRGSVNFILHQDDLAVESCVGGQCSFPIVRLTSTFGRGGVPTGLSEVVYGDGSLLRAQLNPEGAPDGFAARFDREGRLLSAGRRRRGAPVGRWWRAEPEYGAILFGEAEDSGNKKGDEDVKISDSEGLLLHAYNGSDIFAIRGEFAEAMLQGEGRAFSVGKAWFTEGGLMLNVEAASHPIEERKGKTYRFRPGPNLTSNRDKFLAQAAWLWNARRDELEPRGAIRDMEAIERQWRDGENLTFSMPTHPDPKCAALKRTDPAVPGSLRERWLSCYPGSGSKWFMSLLSWATGLNTWGCLGPMRTGYAPDSAILSKTHHQDSARWQKAFSVLSKHKSKKWSRWPEDIRFRMADIALMKGRAVLQIRNPYDALISFWNHDRTGSYDGGPAKDGLKDLAPSLLTEHFREFARREILLWEELYQDYLSVGSSLVVVHYENIKEDARREVTRVAGELGLSHLLNETSLGCTLSMHHDKIKRKKKHLEDHQDPFDQEGLRDLVEGAIERVQESLQFRGLQMMPVEKYKWRKEARP